MGKNRKLDKGEFFDTGVPSCDKGFINTLVRTPGNGAIILVKQACKKTWLASDIPY